ncbi:CrcB family protein [Arthrobacter sp. H20]|uniref:fluoride efflux transporter FluC n=1 Tax=Arthrobacter sp. H20 TaxID=1267981 RepID=UPI00047A11F6|nr:CrcB family protein [Arthrobacter sp. H20]
MSVLLVLLIGAAGGLGAVTRFMLDGVVRFRFATAIPWSTVAINVLGSGLLGLLAGLALGGGLPVELELAAGVGFLGGFTTFSTASVETLRLIQSGRVGRGLVNALGTAALALLAAAAGVAVGSLFVGS